MRRTSPLADDPRETPTELIARISAERAAESTGRHRRATPPAAPASRTAARRTTVRRLAPVGVGVAVMAVATAVVTLLQPAGAPGGPELNSALAAPVVPPAAPTPAGGTPTSAPTTTAPTTTAAPTTRAPRPTTRAATPRAASGPVRSALTSAGEGLSAAAAHGWTLVGGDEFTGGKSSNWSVYEGAGHAGAGRRVASAITVQNGVLVIRGDANGNTGGMAWDADQRFGKWEMRARFPKGDRQYHPVLILWPNGSWPEGGEVDFAETTSASNDVSFFLHYGSSNSQKSAKKTIDITQWHNYAVEWADGRITGYIDGQQWFQSTDPNTMPPDKMHATIQLDYFPDGGSPQPTELQVDYLRIYR